jgi:biopolymer transport protein ExbB/TolQ
MELKNQTAVFLGLGMGLMVAGQIVNRCSIYMLSVNVAVLERRADAVEQDQRAIRRSLEKQLATAEQATKPVHHQLPEVWIKDDEFRPLTADEFTEFRKRVDAAKHSKE